MPLQVKTGGGGTKATGARGGGGTGGSAASACPDSNPIIKAKNMRLKGDFLSTATALN
jgi:hypothetical protein